MNFHLSGAQLGITLTSLALGVLAEPVVAPLIEPIFGTFLSESGAIAWSVVLALLLTTVAQMVVGELIPKSVAVSRPLSTALRVAAPFRIFVAVFRPAIAACNALANGILLAGGHGGDRGALLHPEPPGAPTPGPVVAGAGNAAGTRGGTARPGVPVPRQDRGRRHDAETRCPRTARASATTADLLAASSSDRPVPIPGLRDTGEHDLDEVVGVVHVKDILGIPPGAPYVEPLVDLIRPVLMVPESKPLDDLMEELQPESGQFAVVLDEYGSPRRDRHARGPRRGDRRATSSDEHDPGRSPERRRAGGPERTCCRVGCTATRSRRPAVSTSRRATTRRSPGSFSTSSGSIPTVGMGLAYQGWQIEVAEMDGRRVALVRVVAPPPTPLAGAESGTARAERLVSGVALALVAFGLIAVNGLFVAVEFSLLASRAIADRGVVDEGRFGSVSALAAHARRQRPARGEPARHHRVLAPARLVDRTGRGEAARDAARWLSM